MKHFLLAFFILTAGLIKSQCALTASVTPETCAGTCDAKVTINLSPGCTAFPYNLVINGGTCTPTGTFVMTGSSITFSNLCGCTGLYTATLYGSLPFPITFTTFTIFSGLPLTIVAAPFPATCSSCCDGSVTANTLGGTAPYSYTWTPSVTTGSAASSVCPGTYSVCVSDSKGCSTCTTVTVNFVPLSIEENQKGDAKVLNSREELIISDEAPLGVVLIYDLTGRQVYKSDKSNQKELRISKSQFNKGVYVLSIEGSKRFSKHKIIIE